MPAAVRAYPMLAASVALAVGPSPAGAGAPPPGRSAPAEPPGGLLCRDGLPDREPDAVPRTEVAEHPLQQRPVLRIKFGASRVAHARRFCETLVGIARSTLNQNSGVWCGS